MNNRTIHVLILKIGDEARQKRRKTDSFYWFSSVEVFLNCEERSMAAINVSRSLSTRPFFLNTIDQLPESLLELVNSYLPSDQVVQGIFVVPPETYSRGFRPHLNPLQALIFTHLGILHITASFKRGQPGDGVWISADEIMMIKLSLILLYGKLEIFAVQNGQVASIEVEYNTVAHDLLAPVLRGLIKKTWQKNPAKFRQSAEDATFSDFVNISFSFYNGLNNEAIQPGERVRGYVYQPEIREPWLKIFHRKIYPQIVLALTDQQLILLQQDLKFQTHHEWIFTFIPLYRIASIEQVPYKTWQKVSIQINTEPNQQSIDLILAPEDAKKWQAIWMGVNAIDGK